MGLLDNSLHFLFRGTEMAANPGRLLAEVTVDSGFRRNDD